MAHLRQNHVAIAVAMDKMMFLVARRKNLFNVRSKM